MTREEMLLKVEQFENDAVKYASPSMVYFLFPILIPIWFYKTIRRRVKFKKVYQSMVNDLLSMESQLDPKDFAGWKKRIIAAYQG